MTEPLTMWVIYDHPKDFPDGFVARQWRGEQPTESVIMAKNLGHLRAIMLAEFGLACLARSPGDDPAIVETWL